MNATCHWMLWCVAKNEAKALKLLNRVVAQLRCVPAEFRCDRDEDIPGFAVYFETAAVGSTWADVVFSMLSLGQRTARLWTVVPHMVGRPLEDAVEAFSDESFVPGIRRIQWHINHPERACAVVDDLA